MEQPPGIVVGWNPAIFRQIPPEGNRNIFNGGKFFLPVTSARGAGATCFPAQCPAAANQRETVASGG